MITLRFLVCALIGAAMAVGCGSAAPPTSTTALAPANVGTEPPEGSLAPGTYTLAPFSPGWNGCPYVDDLPIPECPEPEQAYSMNFRVTVPPGWRVALEGAVVRPDRDITNEGPDGMGIVFNRGGWLHDNPCRIVAHSLPAIRVGPTVSDFVEALDAHPDLNVTPAEELAFAGHTGQYVELTVPSDIGRCAFYRPWEPNVFAFGADAVWELRILDVDGVRVVIQSWYYPGTSDADRSELHAVLESLLIVP